MSRTENGGVGGDASLHHLLECIFAIHVCFEVMLTDSPHLTLGLFGMGGGSSAPISRSSGIAGAEGVDKQE